MDELNFSGEGIYQIKVKGHLDERWCEWFEGLEISTIISEAGMPITTITGAIQDQAALHGVIAKIRDIHMPLISVIPIEPEQEIKVVEQEGEENGGVNST